MAKRPRKSDVPYQKRKGLVDARGKRISAPHVLIGVPVQDNCTSWFAYDYGRLTGFSIAAIQGLRLQSLFTAGTYLGPQRQDIADAALQINATHVLFLDSDMRFPKDTLARLLQHNVPIVGANYIRRRPPHLPVAWAKGTYVYTYDNSEGLVPVDHTGFGAMLVETEVFRRINFPFFDMGYVDVGEVRPVWHGEDVKFFEKARLAGFKVMIDQDLSRQVSHTGTMDYTYIHGLDAKEFIERVAEKEAENGSDNGLRIAQE